MMNENCFWFFLYSFRDYVYNKNLSVGDHECELNTAMFE